MDGGELVGRPDGEDHQEDEAGEIDGAASAEAGVAADEDHADVGEPHGEGEQNLGVAKVGDAVGDLREERADEEAGGHAGQTEEERLEGDEIEGLKRRQLDSAGCEGLGFKAGFLDEVEDACDERNEERGISGQEKRDVEEKPAGVEAGERGGAEVRAEGGKQAEENGEGEEEDSEREGFVSGVDEQEGQREEDGEE